MPLELPPELFARPARHADLPDLYALQAAYEQQALGEVLIDLEDLESDWQQPSFAAERDSVLVLDGDRAVATAQLWPGHRTTACVHPDLHGRGIGTWLLAWTTQAAAQAGRRRIGQTVPDSDLAAVQLFRRHGWTPLYTSWLLELPPGRELEPRPLPAGYSLRTFHAGQDERAAYQVVEDAFGEWPNRQPTSYGDWAAAVLGRPGFEPWQLLLAVEGDAGPVVGVCHLVLSGGAGWVNQLAVAREHRDRGIAQALLSAASRAARERGAEQFELSTDSRTGALPLYERLGMRVKSAFTHWSTDLS